MRESGHVLAAIVASSPLLKTKKGCDWEAESGPRLTERGVCESEEEEAVEREEERKEA